MSSRDLIVGPGEVAPVKGVPSGIDSMGTGNADSIEGNRVVLTVPNGEVSPSSSASLNRPLSNFSK